MKIRNSVYLIIGVVMPILLSGCAGMFPPPAQWQSEPQQASVDNPQFSAQLKPVCGSYGGCEAFVLQIVNKTSKNIEVDWNRTLYISGGQTSGGFMFEGVVYKDRNNPKPPDVVFGNGTFTKTIWPNNLVNYVSGKYGGWQNEGMPQGDNGVYLSLSVDGKDVSERLLVRLSISQGL